MLSPGQNFRILPIWLPPRRKYRIGIFDHRVAKTGKKSWRKTSHTTGERSKAKYYPWVKTLEFYPSGRTLVESIKLEFSAIGRPKRVKNPGKKLYAPLMQSSKVPWWYPALCRVPLQHFRTLHQRCVKFLSMIFYHFWPYSDKILERNISHHWCKVPKCRGGTLHSAECHPNISELCTSGA